MKLIDKMIDNFSSKILKNDILAIIHYPTHIKIKRVKLSKSDFFGYKEREYHIKIENGIPIGKYLLLHYHYENAEPLEKNYIFDKKIERSVMSKELRTSLTNKFIKDYQSSKVQKMIEFIFYLNLGIALILLFSIVYIKNEYSEIKPLITTIIENKELIRDSLQENIIISRGS